MGEVPGYVLVARALRQLGATHVFSVSGSPTIETLATCAREGVRPIGVRNEQSGVMMAAAQNYAAGRCVGVPILASGPAVTNAVTGVVIARDNCWPLVVLGGRSPLNMSGMGAFQELDAVPLFHSVTKWSAVVETTARIPEYLSRAFQVATYGRPGPVYLDLPQDVLMGTIDEEKARPVEWHSQPPPPGDPEAIRRAAELLLQAERPALLLGKGVRWSEPYQELRQLVETLGMPFLTSPMGRGYIPDDHPLNFSPARGFLQRSADTVLLVGARLNWIFRFGAELAPDAKIIQVDIEPQEIGRNRPATVGIVGDAKQVLRQLLAELEGKTQGLAERAEESPWLTSLREKREENEGSLDLFLYSDAVPMTPHRMLKEIREFLPRDAICVVDGNLILGAGRQALPSYTPASRLNSGTNGCMGVGVPFGIGAKLANPDRLVVSICGDCSFGFSAMEMETALRHNIPVVYLVENNEGISGALTQDAAYPKDYPERVTMYLPDIRYEEIARAFGGYGEYVERPEELKPALERAVASGVTACINVKVDPRAAYPGPGGRPRSAAVMMRY